MANKTEINGNLPESGATEVNPNLQSNPSIQINPNLQNAVSTQINAGNKYRYWYNPCRQIQIN